MIFLTVGTQLPFDRLVRCVDAWAEMSHAHIFAQIGDSDYQPRNFPSEKFMGENDFEEKFRAANLIIAHAGMGTILSAMSYGIPIMIMPRKSIFGEHRNDHQVATAKRFRNRRGILVAFDDDDVFCELEKIDSFGSPERIGEFAPEETLHRLSLAINGRKLED